MKANGFGIVLAAATTVTLLAPAAQAQRVDCTIVAEVFSGTQENGYCAGDTGVCLVFYLECDGQPWPLPPSVDATTTPGHLVIPGYLANPEPRLTFLSRSDGPLVAQPLTEADPNLSLATSYCESDHLFERLDRRRSPEFADQEFKKAQRAVGLVAPAPALP